MFKTTGSMVLPTTITGSLPRPAWFTTNLRGLPFRLALTDSTFREQYVDALSCLIRDQELAGLDILTDGDNRFDQEVGGRSWISYVTQRIGGMEGYDTSKKAVNWGSFQPGDILYELFEARVLPRVVDKVQAGPLEYTPLWKVAQKLTTKPVKFGTITAEIVESLVTNKYYQDRRDLVMDLAEILNRELIDLAQAGCPVVQIEEPWVHRLNLHADDREMGVDFYVEAFNRVSRGLRQITEVWCHTCWGSPAAQRNYSEPKLYGEAVQALDRLDADVITFEAADNGGAELDVIGAGISKDKKIALGVVSHRTLQVERPEQVADLVRRALKYIEPERLVLSTDCGFGREGMPRRTAFYKMVSIVRGANIVRQELGLPLAECRAADPAFVLSDD